MAVTLDKPLPEFTASATGGITFKSADHKGKKLVLYFYSKDNTAGCTNEAKSFRDLFGKFQSEDTVIFGISRDSLKSHENFKVKHQLPFELISDADETVCTLFDVIRPKKMYGREFMGVERSTFLVDAKGILRKEWRKVKTAGHTEEVLAAVKQLG
jgi:Peroxiredoxin